MGQSLAQVYIHLVFGTKNREPSLDDGLRDGLHSYIGGILQKLDSPVLAINSMADHVHLLFRLSRTTTLAKAEEDTKKVSSRWIKSRPGQSARFAWQVGYGAFSVSASMVPAVTAYIEHQPEHHRQRTFKEELQMLFDRHGVVYDERYLWG